MKPEQLAREIEAMAREAAEVHAYLQRYDCPERLKPKAEQRLLHLYAQRWRDRWSQRPL